ncbi:MAG: 2-amino-4-hydroxy-6-hydroxymethyldihydropteridine diphosphokinase [Aeromonas sp.]
MFYLCSIGSNLDPHTHVSAALAELAVHFGPLQLSSVIRTKPVGMHSCHDFLNCLFVAESTSSTQQLKQLFVAMELAHGRDRSDPLCKVHDRPLDIDILACSTEGNFATARVDPYLTDLHAELYGRGEVHDPKVMLQVQIPGRWGNDLLSWPVGLAPLTLDSPSESRQGAATIHLDAGTGHIAVSHQ